MTYVAGIDAGSVSAKIAILDEQGEVLFSEYRRHKGKPLDVSVELLKDALAKYPGLRISVTGSAGKIVAQKLGAPHINELLALSASTRKLYPEVRSVVELGGEDSKFLLLGKDAIEDFSLNSVCAAGTGSFLDQQAERMRLSIEEFAEMALKCETPPRIAGRCSVFAKSDMIHLQQIATPVEDIVGGLCFSVARNFKAAIVRNRPMPGRIAFMGGVALNKGMIRAFSEILETDDLLIPEPPTVMGAIGAALKAQAEDNAALVTSEELETIDLLSVYADKGQRPLVQEGDSFMERHMGAHVPLDSLPDAEAVRAVMESKSQARGGKIPAFMGIDIGSISTNVVVVDEAGELLSKRYLRTAGQPIEAVLTGLREVGHEVADFVEIKGVGTTGSGRYMIADFVSADVVKNEITAQGTASAFIDPEVDTIFEIGGQDSKYIQLKDGVITDFEMNKACAAGTGSFLEEQAEKLHISIKKEFACQALESDSPCRLGERCTVFMENSLQDSLQRGAAKDDVVAGLAYSIVENYINRVVNGRPIGDHIFFQGGTAFNKAVVAAFEKFLDRQITVPPNHDVTGAIGMGLIARDHMKDLELAQSSFKGFGLVDRGYTLKSFECKSCDNHCEINRVKMEGEDDLLFYGGRCEKYDIRKKFNTTLPDLFGFREEALEKAHNSYLEVFKARGRKAPKGIMGVPRVFFMLDYLPYYTTLLWELGFEVELSPYTDKHIAAMGVNASIADMCFPAKAALGHVQHLLEKGITRQFIPSCVSMVPQGDKYEFGHTCPLTQSFPYQSKTAFSELEIVAPVIRLRYGDKYLRKLLHESLSGLGVSKSELKQAMNKANDAQATYTSAIQNKGKEILADLPDRTLVIMGRPYNSFDMGMNLEIPRKLATLNVLALPMDFLPPEDIYDDWPDMYWRSGQRILKACRTVKKNPKLNALFIGNFSCGPDSFIQKFVDVELAGKPYLHVEIDEHSADAGVITRCEAFLDSLTMQERSGKQAEVKEASVPKRTAFLKGKKRTVYLPNMCDHSYAIQAAFQACGVDAEILPEADDEALALGRKYSSGKECYPFIVTLGDMLKTAMSKDFDPDRSAFLMFGGNGPCRFGQYNVEQRHILKKVGLGDVPIYAPVQDMQFYDELGMVGNDFLKKGWQGTVCTDLLTKCLHETRPYEKEPGSAIALYKQSILGLQDTLRGSNGSLPAFMGQVRKDFENLPRHKEKRPLIGIVGEIYVRSNRFANEGLIEKIEALGGEAWLAPVDEWIYYINWESKDNALRRRRWKTALQFVLMDRFQAKLGQKIEQQFDGFLKTIHDPSTKDVLKHAKPYLHDSFRGEAVLSIGKSIDMITRVGACGIINTLPFGCMPGSVVAGILPRVGKDLDTPSISIPFDGTASPTMQLQLEAFMEQAHRRLHR